MILRRATCLAIFMIFLAVANGCAKRKLYGSQFQSGYIPCNGTPGQFNLVLSVSAADPGAYVLQLQAIDYTGGAGTRYHVAIANSNNSPPYRDIALRATFQRGQTVELGVFSREDIKLYPYVVIARSADANADQTNFLNNASNGGVICTIPTTDNETQYPL